MKYCPETVLVQSAFVCASNKPGFPTTTQQDVKEVCEIVVQAIKEVSSGLSYGGEKRVLEPVEVKTLMYKFHAWIYTAWRGGLGVPGGTYFSEFPPLPPVGTAVYVELVKRQHWDDFLVECLLYSTHEQLVTCLQELITAITQAPDAGDMGLFVVLFTVLLNQQSTLSDYNSDGTIVERRGDVPRLLLTGLNSSHQQITNSNTQITIVKKMIEFIYSCISANKSEIPLEYIFTEGTSNTDNLKSSVTSISMTGSHQGKRLLDKCLSAVKLEKLDVFELKRLHSDLSVELGVTDSSGSVENSSNEANNGNDKQESFKDSNMKDVNELKERMEDNIIQFELATDFIKMLYSLFTEHWKGTFNWSICCHDDGHFYQMETHSWHPLHQWIVGLFAALERMFRDDKECLHCDKVKLMHKGLNGYIEEFATEADHQFISATMDGSINEYLEKESLKECFIEDTELSKALHAKFPSPRDQFLDALWRVNNHLEGYEACMDWLLTAEEFFNDSEWLDCVKSNALVICGKAHALMMVDIMCVQWQMIDSNGASEAVVMCAVYEGIRGVFSHLFDTLPETDKEDIIAYTYSMSTSLAKDPAHNSVLFHPHNGAGDKSKLQQELRVTFNRLVDEQDEAFSRIISGIAHLALLSPVMTLTSAVQTAVQYGRTHTICKVLQRLPSLCQLCSCETDPPLLCSILQQQACQLKSHQEETNIIKLVNLLLQPFKPESCPAPHDPLLSITDLIKTCILPHLHRHSNQEGISIFIALRLLNTSLAAIQTDQSDGRTFVLRFLIPIILCLCKLLHGCKVSWEGLVPVSSPVEVAGLRGLVLTVLEAAVKVVVVAHQGGLAGLDKPVQWLYSKVKMLDWTIPLYMAPMLQSVQSQAAPLMIPASLYTMCDLPRDVWTACTLPDYDPIIALFECVSVSDAIADRMSKALSKGGRLPLTGSDVRERITYNLVKMMTYRTGHEIRRIIRICTLLMRRDPHESNPVPSLSRVLRDVMTTLTSPCCSWATPRVLGHVIKHYVMVVKELCSDVNESGDQTPNDLISLVISDVCHVMCHLPDDVTHPLFVLALDLVSMATTNEGLRQSVAKLPQQVYRDALLQKLSSP